MSAASSPGCFGTRCSSCSGTGARRHRLAGPPAQRDALGEPQRLLVHPRSRDRRIPLREAVHEGDVDQRADAKGRPQNVVRPTAEGTSIYPHFAGATNWYSPSYSPVTGPVRFLRVGGLVFDVLPPARGICRGPRVPRRLSHRHDAQHQRHAGEPAPARRRYRGRHCRRSEDRDGEVAVSDERRHRRRRPDHRIGPAVLRGREGYVFALEARTGALLWKGPVAGIVQAASITYTADGRQYVAIAAGNTLYGYALRR
jgi:alcohol dehydrogenase (cytochrome c)